MQQRLGDNGTEGELRGVRERGVSITRRRPAQRSSTTGGRAKKQQQQPTTQQQ